MLKEEVDETKVDNTRAAKSHEFYELSGYLEAQEIMGDDFFGLDEVENALGYTLDRSSTPGIPFTREELEQARANNEFLILYASHSTHNEPITMQRLNLNSKPATTPGAGKILYDTSWYKDEEFFTSEHPRLGWKLVTKDVIPDSISKDYFNQTQTIVDNLQGLATIPPEYEEAFSEWDDQKAEINGLMLTNWQEAARRLEALKVNDMFRQTPVEALYANLVYSQIKGQRLMEGTYTWTNTPSSNGSLVFVGGFDSGGAGVYNWEPDDADDDVGVALSR